MTPILDPRNGDIEDDASSTKKRSMLSLAGSLLAEISLPKLVIAWMLLIGFPGLLLGAAPLLVSIWIAAVWSHAANIFYEILPALLLPLLMVIGWFAGRPLLRLAESSFWSLNALAVQPAYIVFREGIRHLAEGLLASRMSDAQRGSIRAGAAAASGLLICGLGFGIIILVWPATAMDRQPGGSHVVAPARARPAGEQCCAHLRIFRDGGADLGDCRCDHGPAAGFSRLCRGDGQRPNLARRAPVGHPHRRRALWISHRERKIGRTRQRAVEARYWRDWMRSTRANPLDIILITGDLTDAGRSAEWAEFFAALAAYPRLAELVIALPGNHDVNVVDRASPARMDLPTSPMKRLRQVRTISALGMLQGSRLHVVESSADKLGGTLADALKWHGGEMAAFADNGSLRLSRSLAGLWATIFPMVMPPATDDGLGVIVLNSNAETHFSFTNALGLVSAEQARGLSAAVGQYPRACWIVALHHHVIEYPKPAKALSERIGTALINGSWFIRRLQHLANHAVIMHGHRHIDWIGECGGLLIVSAPSPVMAPIDCQETYFYVHTLAVGADERLKLLAPERINVRSQPVADEAWV